jgi:type II secretory pathway component PulK
VLIALLGGLDAQSAAALVASRASAPFTTLGDFRGRLARPNLTVDETLLSVSSDNFVVTIEAQLGDTVARARALLWRAATPGAWPYVVWQTVE